MLTIQEKNERASNKAFAKILSLEAKQINLKKDLKSGSYGPITKEEMELLINRNNVEIEVWNYIAKLIETDKMEQNNQVNLWDLTYKLYKGKYTREQIDDMTFAEVSELIDIYYDYEN